MWDWVFSATYSFSCSSSFFNDENQMNHVLGRETCRAEEVAVAKLGEANSAISGGDGGGAARIRRISEQRK
ncbi:hypothetical protein P8452_61012 [Trifolium repens]|jgi:hypothetical protein|nr:hypothetical protein P8452_61012 [Trifolium repens]